MCKTFYDKFEPCFGGENLQLHCEDSGNFVLSIRTQNILNDLNFVEDLFDFSNLNQNHELFSSNESKLVGKYKIENPKIIWTDEFTSSKSNASSLRCGSEHVNNLKGFSRSQSKNIKFDENYFCLFGGDY